MAIYSNDTETMTVGMFIVDPKLEGAFMPALK